MFKVGDRVKRVNGSATCPTGSFGEITNATSLGTFLVQWDMYAGRGPSGPYNATELATVNTHNWQPGDLFEVTMDDGRPERGQLTSTPANGGKYAAVMILKSGKQGGLWSFKDAGPQSFEALARPVAAAVQYKPGDKVIATKEHGRDIGLPVGHVKQGEIGVIVAVAPTYFRVEFDNGRGSHLCGPEYIAPYAGPSAPLPTLSCIRCHEPNQYAEANLPGGGYACYSCRKYHAYALGVL